MNLTIKNLKTHVDSGSKLVSDCDEQSIKRYPNNIIQINGKSVSWRDLIDIVQNGDCKIVTPKGMTFHGHKIGGYRPGTGRKRKYEKNINFSISMDKETTEKLNDLQYYFGLKRSRTIQCLIKEMHGRLIEASPDMNGGPVIADQNQIKKG